MRIVYMGTPDFAVEPLEVLYNSGNTIAAVVTAADKPSGRGQKIQQSPVKQFAISHNIPVLQPVRLRDEGFIQQLKFYNADLFVVVAFRMLPDIVWTIPPKGTINLHASLLPQYRGAAPINSAIINGEKTTGLTTFFITHEIDTGSILLQKEIEISETETAGELHDKLMHAGAQLLLETIQRIDAGNITPTEQPQIGGLKKAPKLTKDNCRINWNADVSSLYNFIRGLCPYPAAWTELYTDNQLLGSIKIYKAQAVLQEHRYNLGKILSDGKSFIKVACSGGYLLVDELQLAGKKRLSAADFLRGFKQDINTCFFM